MILYTEGLLEKCYTLSRLHQVSKDLSFMKLEDFRLMFEDMMLIIYSEEEK